ncbi:hypothetical protein PRUPE_4G043100 [Prunus persica]|nr:hypothetical protein PRUPE_4G043100 [Prunus persica]
MEGLDALTAVFFLWTKFSFNLHINLFLHIYKGMSSFPYCLTCSSWFLQLPLDGVTSIVDGLKILYGKTLRPLELTYNFNDFVSPSLTDGDFDAKPMVLFLGQYLTGKTTFVKHLLNVAIQVVAHIGLEPANDRFVVVMSGPDARRSIPGNTIAVNADLLFSGLASFGGSFLSKFESKAQQRLIDNLEDEFAKRELHLPAGDFPDVVCFREVLEGYDVDKLER